jgi:uncharacterized protein
MTKRMGFHIGMICLVVGILACAGSAPSRFYTLSPLAESTETRWADTPDNGVVVGIGPVVFPEYLDRPQIVTRLSPNELNLNEFNKWAEPLKDTFTRVLTENLSALLSPDAVRIFPWRSAVPLDYQLDVSVVRFDGNLGEPVTLIVRWNILGSQEKELLVTRRSVYTQKASGSDYAALVAAKSSTLEQFSRDAADALKRVIAAGR